MLLNEIIKDFKGEDFLYECKAILSRSDILGWLKTIGGFANSKGGSLIVGVEDKTYKVIGIDHENLDKEKLFFYNTVKTHIESNLDISSEVIEYSINNKKRYLLRFNVLESQNKPVIIKYDGLPLIYKRRDGFTNNASSEEIRNMVLTNKETSYDTLLSDVKFNKDDFKKLYAFYKSRTNKELNEKVLSSIPFFNEEGYLYKGSLLFKDDIKGDNLRIVCNLFPFYNRGSDKVLTSNVFNGNLIDGYEFIMNFINLYQKHSFIKEKDRRVDLDAYPYRALFEAIINALVHRDYFEINNEINVNLFKDRLTISSPGSLYDGSELEPTYNFSSLVSKRRNKLISSIFVLCEAMEAKGTGFEKIINEYKDVSFSFKPYIYSKYNTFTIVLADLTNEGGMKIDNERVSFVKEIKLKYKSTSEILLYCLNEERSVSEICSYLKITPSSYFRDNVIEKLKEEDLLIENKIGNKKTYKTNIKYIKLL